MNKPLAITNVGVVCALGTDKATIIKRALTGDTSGMTPITVQSPDGTSRFGAVVAELDPSLPRCNALLDLATAQIADDLKRLFDRYPAERIGVVLGSSNSEMEEFTANPVWNNMASPAEHLAKTTGARGPAYTISTACSSSAKAFASARKLIQDGVCDAVLVGGADTYSRVVTDGFAALEALSSTLTRPLSAERNGINLGEGAAVFILEKGDAPVMLLGVGESSDAHHLTAPDPEGKGAETSMRQALADAILRPEDIAWVQLHGTGTTYNDAMEMGAVNRVFGDSVAVSSTKPLTGHTLGAAGAISAALACLALDAAMPVPHAVEGEADASLPPNPRVKLGDQLPPNKAILLNAFAFGGSNASVILGPAIKLPLPVILPHNDPMILLSDYDRQGMTESGLTAFVDVTDKDVFYDSEIGGVPNSTALEYMAQTMAAFIGLAAVRAGTKPKIGFVLGSRKLDLRLPFFQTGCRYTITCELVFNDTEFASFNCNIKAPSGEIVAEGLLNAFQPDSIESALPN